LGQISRYDETTGIRRCRCRRKVQLEVEDAPQISSPRHERGMGKCWGKTQCSRRPVSGLKNTKSVGEGRHPVVSFPVRACTPGAIGPREIEPLYPNGHPWFLPLLQSGLEKSQLTCRPLSWSRLHSRRKEESLVLAVQREIQDHPVSSPRE